MKVTWRFFRLPPGAGRAVSTTIGRSEQRDTDCVTNAMNKLLVLALLPLGVGADQLEATGGKNSGARHPSKSLKWKRAAEKLGGHIHFKKAANYRREYAGRSIVRGKRCRRQMADGRGSWTWKTGVVPDGKKFVACRTAADNRREDGGKQVYGAR